MGRPQTLFDTKVSNAENIRIGVTPGSHVIHVLGEKDKKELGSDIKPRTGENKQDNYTHDDLTSGYGQVSHEEIFYNDADLKTRENFINLMQESENLYGRDFGKYTDDVKSLLENVRDYMCANSRSGQQDALKNVRIAMGKLSLKIQKDAHKLQDKAKKMDGNPLKLDKKDQDQILNINDVNMMIAKYNRLLITPAMGDLKIDPEVDKAMQPAPEPEITFFGYSPKGVTPGTWEPTNDALFPHEPSPNDVKQGVGLMSCFMLSVLTNVAAKNPNAIREAMKDNGDGTVTVRFFDPPAEEGGEPKPVYVKVNKTVNKSFFNNNLYASSSVWVQMMEKAYAEYMAMKDPESKNRSMERVNRGNASEFSEHLTGEKAYLFDRVPLGKDYPYYKQNGRHELINHPPYYLPEEKKIFKIMDNAINKRKEIMTVGNATLAGDSLNAIGLRVAHRYAVTKVFEKVVDGKVKYFVQVRDPYATFEVKYGPDKKFLDTDKKEYVKATVNGGLENMGTYNLELTDFFNLFNTRAGVSKQTADELNEAYKTFRDYTANPLSEEELKDENAFDHSFDGTRLVNEKADEEKFARMMNMHNGDDFSFDGNVNPSLGESGKNVVDDFGIDFGKDDFGLDENKDEIKPEDSKDEASLDDFEMPETVKPANKEYDNMDLADFELPPQFDEDQMLANSLDDEKIFNITQNLARSRSELAATDGLLVLTNTKPFRDMKKELESITAELLNTMKAKKIEKATFVGELGSENVYDKTSRFNEKEKLDIAKKLNRLQRLANDYAEKKYRAVNSGNAKTSDYSERAVKRFAIASNIKNVCRLDYPQSTSPRETAKLLVMSYADIAKNILDSRAVVARWSNIDDLTQLYDGNALYYKVENDKEYNSNESFDFSREEDYIKIDDNQDKRHAEFSMAVNKQKLKDAQEQLEKDLHAYDGMRKFFDKNLELWDEVNKLLKSDEYYREKHFILKASHNEDEIVTEDERGEIAML